ncbi:nuclear transport factor 2 family protein [Paracoccus sp. 1_MG-2023]|nr:nuclear transport factor 2 family protein [Paracoccus sp. 1_MG-2023]MBU2959161.1 nuclear transport factor 2 family protein [Paracoccus sp. C2R09]
MSHIELLRKWVEAFNTGHVETMAMLYADHAVNFQTKNLLSVGKSAIIRGFVEEFSRPRISRSVDNIHEDGEWMILEWKDALGYRGCQIFQMAGGSIVLQRGY